MSGDTAAATIGVQPIAELFTAPTTALWATTYNLDIALVSEFLLSRLGDPPLNVTVLADHHQLATSLDRIPAERVATLATVNRRWLLRGVRAGTAFHPKTYLQVTPGRVKLVVGSGNLNTGGLDRGREVFTVFRSDTPAGDTAIASWRTWMRHLVGRIGDATLADRFRDLEERLPAAALGVATGSPLLHNLDTPIAEQLRERLPADEVDELWLTAPFFDRDAVAVGALLESFSPARVRLFVTSWSSVHGPALVARLRGSGAEVTVAAYIPDKFVHAKLVGIVVGGEALLLSGSANLSRAALTTTPSSGGNVEMAVLAPIAVDELRALFIPPGWGVEERSLVSLSRLGFRSYHADLPTPPVRLLSAVAVADGRVQIATESDPDSGWRLDDLVSTYPLTLLRLLARSCGFGPLRST